MRRTGWIAAVLFFAACGDGETEDRRGYTKAPLEKPGIRIEVEARSAMDRIGVPNRPSGEPIVLPDSAG